MTRSTDSSSTSAAEEAARRSRRGYQYQDLVAASFCLQMLCDPKLQKVACETQDDVVLTWTDPAGSIFEEFIQVKSDRQKQQWSVSMFCEQRKEPPTKNCKDGSVRYRKDTSIFEKNALRDAGKHSARFRIVTRADVSELRLLTEVQSARCKKKTSELAKKLGEKLNGNTTLTSANIEHWLSHAFWEVRGTESAIFDDNYHRLAKAVEAIEQRLLAVVDLERILYKLTEETSAMAMGKGRCGSDPSSVTSEELREWLTTEVRAIPHFLGSIDQNALLREERHSLARCEMLWLALGVSKEDAAALSRQPTIGARPEFFAEFLPGFHWVTAGYGAGKSLAVERLFQAQVADYAAQRSSRVPIFLRAPGIAGSLQDAVDARFRALYHGAGSPPLFVVLDAVDEAGISRAHRFLQEAYELSATSEDSIFIVTSPKLPFNFEPFHEELPRLTDEQAAVIVSHFCQYEVYPWKVRERLGEDYGVALMCVLLGMTLRDKERDTPSRGQLLNLVVEAARKRSGADASGWADRMDDLCRIAMLSTDSGGGPVRFSELGMTSIEATSLASTKLVIEEAGNLVFTVATMRLWFAAQALKKNWVDEKELVSNLPRIRFWKDSLAIFIATTDFDSASHYFEPLASTHPGVAAQVIANATSQWGDRSERPPSEFEKFAWKVRRCLEAWLLGISPLGNVCNFTDSKGDLLKVRAGFTEPHTQIFFFDDIKLPPASALPTNWKEVSTKSYSFYIEPDQPTHLWRTTQNMVCGELVKAVNEQNWSLTDPELFYEEVWYQAVGLTYVHRWFSRSISWDAIEKFRPTFLRLRMWKWLCEKRETSPKHFSHHIRPEIAKMAIGFPVFTRTEPRSLLHNRHMVWLSPPTNE